MLARPLPFTVVVGVDTGPEQPIVQLADLFRRSVSFPSPIIGGGGRPTCLRITEAAFDPSIGGNSQHDLAEAGRNALDQWVEELSGLEQCEIRTTDHPEIYTTGIFRFDDQAIAYHYYMGVRGMASVAKLMKRIEVDGEFDALARQIDRVWETGTPYPPQS